MDNIERLIADLKGSLEREIGSVGHRVDEIGREMREGFARMENRMERLETRTTSMEFQLVGINRAMDQSARLESDTAGLRLAQQRAIDDLAARVKRLEERLGSS